MLSSAMALELSTDITPTSSFTCTSHFLVGALIQIGSDASLTSALSCDRLASSLGRWEKMKHAEWPRSHLWIIHAMHVFPLCLITEMISAPK